ncbi:MAG: DUF4349 domain-containing protein [Anaerolineaceae bacterium]|nr:MAG: DUF4349 domain-containing protein [Anaerolineaceae bacterium]
MKRTLFVMMIAAVLLAACGTRALAPAEPSYVERPAMGGGDSVYVEEAYAPEAPLPQGTMMPSTDKAGGNVDAAARERLVIRNADLSIVVKDPEASMTSISKLAEEMGGFVVSSNLYQTYTNSGLPVPEASIVIRVPAEKLNDALEKIKVDAVEVQSENQSGQDVTSEYVDLESQLKNLEAAEKQLTEIMSKAEKTEDVLNVFNQLTSIRGQIESIKGQMKYFEESAALSAVTVRLVAEETVQPIEVLGWKPQGTLRDAVQNLIYFWQDFVDFLIWFAINFLPKLLTIGVVFVLPIWLIVRAIRNASRKRKAAQTPKE